MLLKQIFFGQCFVLVCTRHTIHKEFTKAAIFYPLASLAFLKIQIVLWQKNLFLLKTSSVSLLFPYRRRNSQMPFQEAFSFLPCLHTTLNFKTSQMFGRWGKKWVGIQKTTERKFEIFNSYSWKSVRTKSSRWKEVAKLACQVISLPLDFMSLMLPMHD